MNARYHIQDTVSATVEEYGNSIKFNSDDVQKLTSLVEGKTEVIGDFRFQKMNYHVVCKIVRNQHVSTNDELKKKTKKFNWSVSSGFWEGLGSKTADIKESIRFDFIFQHKDTGNYGRATYALYNVSKKSEDWRLAYIGNPTTLINGHNSGPVVLKEKPGFHENMKLHRVGFEFFFHCIGYEASEELKLALKHGLISLQNTQVAVYVPSSNKDKDLFLLKMLYVRWIGGNTMTSSGAWTGEYIGLKPSASVEEDFTGVMLRGYSGKSNPTFTVNFYDKAKSNENKKKNVPAKITRMLENSLRVDMTLHRRFIDQLASRTFTIVKKKVKEKHFAKSHPYHRFIEQMKDGATSTALVICMIMHVLPKEAGVTFAQFLLREILCEQCLLDKMVSVTRQKLKIDKDAVTEEQQTLYDLWVGSKTKNDWENAKQPYIQGKRRNAFYSNIKHLETLTGVSFDVPYEFWVNIAAFDGLYGLDIADLAIVADANDYQGNDPSERAQLALTVLDLLQKGRRESVEQRQTSLTKTFLEPLGMK